MKRIGQVEVSFRYSRHLGPRFASAGLVLRFDASARSAFRSQALWPDGMQDTAAYEAAIEDAVARTLAEAGLDAPATSVTLLSVEFHPVDSSLDSFRKAAAGATLAALAT